MNLAAAIFTVPSRNPLWIMTAAIVVAVVALAALFVLFRIYWAEKIWERWRIIAHYRHEEREARARAGQKRKAEKPHGGAK